MLNILKKCKNYNNLIGRNEIKSELIKLAQTMDDRFIVFVGSQGTDKEAWADALASNLLCENPREDGACLAVSYTHLTLPTIAAECRSRWSPYH